MYAGGIFLATPGLALILKSWILLLWPILLFMIWSILIRKEENMMKEVFGHEYERYAAKTRRFVPRLF
jgi:protein-S-isoprenylcysteine O-methyltransferase Ste14